MRLFRRESAPSVPQPLPHAFADWLLVATSGATKLEETDFSTLERICGNTSSLLIGAALAAPGTAAVSPADPATAGELARLIARRTADGFSAALADRVHTVLAWPWDHIGTRVAWEVSRNSAHHRAGELLAEWSFAYALLQQTQANEVANLWSQVTAGLDTAAEPKRLDSLGGNALQLYLRERLAQAS